MRVCYDPLPSYSTCVSKPQLLSTYHAHHLCLCAIKNEQRENRQTVAQLHGAWYLRSASSRGPRGIATAGVFKDQTLPSVQVLEGPAAIAHPRHRLIGEGDTDNGTRTLDNRTRHAGMESTERPPTNSWSSFFLSAST